VAYKEPLVGRLVAGDEAAYAECYHALRPRLHGFLLRLCRDPAVAEELLQETFIKLARHAHKLAPDTELAAWLFTVARNAAASHRRWARLDATRIVLWGLRARDKHQQNPEGAATAAADMKRLDAQLQRLNAGEREVLLLAAEGFTPQEIAPMLGLSDDNTRQRLARARKRLHSLIDPEAP
jgi:RNA polymerase sigma-70 factor (ECF subfamily)